MDLPVTRPEQTPRFSRISLVVALASLLVLGAPATGSAGGTAQLDPDEALRYLPVFTESGQTTVLADINSVTSPEISPDGTQVAFSGSVGDGSLGLYALYVVNTDGSGLTQVTSGGFAEFDPAWSPDGRYLYFAQNTTGSLSLASCCRVARIDLMTSVVTAITTPTGAIRPAVSPSGASLSFDNPSGVWTVPSVSGTAVLRVQGGYDSTFSPDGGSLAYVANVGGLRRLRTINISSGAVATLYTTSGSIESLVWRGGRIFFLHHTGSGYDGRSAVQIRSVGLNSLDLRVESATPGRVGLDLFDNDEFFLYRSTDGVFKYYGLKPDATLLGPTTEGTYSKGWDSITAVDLNGDGTDEQFFYRSADGVFKYYQSNADGSLGPLLQDGTYSKGWSSISKVDVDGDGDDEILFYRSTDGVFKYYGLTAGGSLIGPLSSGTYSKGWDSISAVDIDGDGQDEQFFYRSTDGVFKYYKSKVDSTLGSLVQDGFYSTGWSAITRVDLDGDGSDGQFFYRSSDGVFKFYGLTSGGSLVGPIDEGTYSTGWDSISALEVD